MTLHQDEDSSIYLAGRTTITGGTSEQFFAILRVHWFYATDALHNAVTPLLPVTKLARD